MWFIILLFSIQVTVINGRCEAQLDKVVPNPVGTKVTFVCIIGECLNYTGPYPHPVTWFKSSENVTVGVTSSKLSNNRTQSTLVMTLVKSDNNKVIGCRSSADSASATLNVTYKPVVTIEQADNPLIVTEKTKTLLNCLADSNPAPTTYRWTFEGNLLSSRPNVSFTVFRNISGIYQCSVGNSVGSSQADIELQVEYGPTSVSLSPSTPQYDLTEGIDVMPSITCSADCRPPCTYSWGRRRSSAVLNLGEVDRHDAGVYTCRASNKISSMSSTSIKVKVRYPPDILSLETKEKKEGDDLLMECIPRGVPDNFTYHGWYQVSESGGPKVQTGNLTSSGGLFISDLSYVHNGIYNCSVSNGVPTPNGQNVTTGTMQAIIVYGPPHGIQSLYTKTGYLGSTVEFIVEFFQFTIDSSRITVSWYNLTSGEVVTPRRSNITLETMDYTTQFFSTDVNVPGYRIVATIDDVTTWDFGRYVVHLQSVEQKQVVHLKIEREKAGTSDSVDGWMVTTILLLLVVIAGCTVVGVWLYRTGVLPKCGKKKEKTSSEVRDDPDQSFNDLPPVDAVTYDPSLYTALHVNKPVVSENPYSNEQTETEHTYESLKNKNSGQRLSETARAGQQELSPVQEDTSVLYQNVTAKSTKEKLTMHKSHSKPKQ